MPCASCHQLCRWSCLLAFPRPPARLPRLCPQVFKDFLQVLSILQVVLQGWQSAAAAAMSSLSFTPLSTKAWISLDCILPKTVEVGNQLQLYNIGAQLMLPREASGSAVALHHTCLHACSLPCHGGNARCRTQAARALADSSLTLPATPTPRTCPPRPPRPVAYSLMLLAGWLAYAAFTARAARQAFADVLRQRFKPRIVSTLLVLLSYFYPSLAFTILSVFSCRYLDPDRPSDIGGEVLMAQGWFWTQVRRGATRRDAAAAAAWQLRAALTQHAQRSTTGRCQS